MPTREFCLLTAPETEVLARAGKRGRAWNNAHFLLQAGRDAVPEFLLFSCFAWLCSVNNFTARR